MNQNQKHCFVGVINEGSQTISFTVFCANTEEEICSCQKDIQWLSPQEGWAEQIPHQLLSVAVECITEAVQTLQKLGYNVYDIRTIGITNQRETTIVWDKLTGQPLYNAILWFDNRTSNIMDTILARFPDQNKEHLKSYCGLPMSTYFSALKLRWLIEHVPAVRRAVKDKRCYFGTVDSWLVWNLTGGKNGGLHITDVTNASRTMLMNIRTLKWDPILCKHLDIPMDMLPTIRSSSEIYGLIKGTVLSGIPISAILGNQQADLVGQHCLLKGQAKSTYRSGCFLLFNTGHTCVFSSHGLITTVAYQMGKNEPPVYALEGSVAVAGATLEWLCNNLNLAKNIKDAEKLAQQVATSGDVYFVPAFSGLFAPYWRKDARGVICGLTQFTTKAHIIRAALEAVCFQTKDILQSMHNDCEFPLLILKLDGQLSELDLLMQLQADITGIKVVRAGIKNVTSLGAAMAAGQAEGINIWDLYTNQPSLPPRENTFLPTTTDSDRHMRYKKWKMAVHRSLGWAYGRRSTIMTETRYMLLSSVPLTLFIAVAFGFLSISSHLNNK